MEVGLTAAGQAVPASGQGAREVSVRKSGASMTIHASARLGAACVAALALAGCVAGTGKKETGGNGLAAAISPVSVERDVESPQVFNLTGQGLWDGRPSLGGVWVAHSSVQDPERVIIRNAKNGKSVVGALFRRERDLPGPGLQVSSDAAEALGLVAGQPAELSVVALRREEEPVPADAEIGAEDVPADAAAAEETAVAAAVPPADPAAAPPETEAPVAGATAAVPPAEPMPADEAAPKESRGLFGFLKKKPKPMAEPLAAPTAEGLAPGAIEQTTLDPVAASAAAAIDRADAAAAEPAAAAPPVAASAAPAPAAIKRGYIQIGIFSVEANAGKAAEQMRAAGMGATVRSDQSNGKTYWRVIVGPAASVPERDALVARVKAIGYPDAYPVAN